MMNWASVTIGLGGVAVALLTLLLTYRSRFGPYQQKLYERQLDAVTEVLQALGRYHDEGLNILDGIGSMPAVDADRHAQLKEAKAEFFRTYRRWNVVIPQPMTEAVTKYLHTIERLVVESRLRSSPGELPERPKGDHLAAAYAAVLGVAQRELRVKTLSDRTLSSIESLSASPSVPANSVDPLYIKVLAERPLFEDFSDEGRVSTSVPNAGDQSGTIATARNRLYIENRNLFLVHVWRPSSHPKQVADVSIRILEHERRGSWPRSEQASAERPLTDGLIDKVEYYLGSSFMRAFVKRDAATAFRLDISAFGPTLCVAWVHFKDGKPPLTLYRYLDFIAPE
jgi:hypothetical protein